jgi:hypothetical protein
MKSGTIALPGGAEVSFVGSPLLNYFPSAYQT